MDTVSGYEHPQDHMAGLHYYIGVNESTELFEKSCTDCMPIKNPALVEFYREKLECGEIDDVEFLYHLS